MKAVALTLVLGTTMFAASQTAVPKPEFEVTSVKQNNSGSRAINFTPSPRRFVAQNVTLKMLIQYAYDLPNLSITGGPDWINADRFDIEARAADRASKQQIEGPMLQRLLEDRFQLVVRWEKKESLMYVLTVSKGGPTLTEGSCIKRDPNAPSSSSQNPSRFCGFLSMNNNVLKATQIDTARLAEELSHWLKSPVIDKTGITRKFDVELKWNLDETTATPSPDTAPSLFTALQDHLGLRLQSTRGPVDVLVIESVQKPSEN